MKEEFKIERAVRKAMIPLVGLYGKSGGGKTHSALLFARGLVGQTGRIVLIDTENGRGCIFSDIVEGGYDVLPLGPPFTPDRYRAAIAQAEKVSDVVVIDSMSHEWEGEGGVIEAQEEIVNRMAKGDPRKKEQCNMAAWREAKKPHALLTAAILRLSVPVICCFRANNKVKIERNPQTRKQEITISERPMPIFDKKFIFEMLIYGEVFAKNGVGGYSHIDKSSHPKITGILPGENKQLDIKHGVDVALWCNDGVGVASAEKESLPSATEAFAPVAKNYEIKKAELWKSLQSVWDGKGNLAQQAVTEWMVLNGLIKKGEFAIKAFGEDVIDSTIDQVDILLNPKYNDG